MTRRKEDYQGSVTSIIIDYFTRRETLKLVEQMLAFGSVHEVLVVDNTGNEEYQSGWPQDRERFRVLRSLKREGFGSGVNRGVGLVTTQFVIILNSDIDWKHGSPGRLAGALVERGLGAVAPTIFDSHGLRQLDALGAFPARWSLRKRSVDSSAMWITGACMLLETTTFRTIGGFDDRYFMYWEDVDFCRTLLQEGRRVGVSPVASVQHISGSSDRVASSRYANAVRSRQRYMQKWAFPLVQRWVAWITGKLKLAWMLGWGE